MQKPIEQWVFVLIPLVIVGLGFLIASMRRGSVSGTHLGSRRHTLHNAADPAMVFERLRAIGHPYRVDDADPEHRILVLSSPPTFATWGFLYPIVITPDGSGGSQIQLGITSRFIQFGPLVTKWHNKLRDEVQHLLGVPAARVTG
jgi:hypothetical protein